MYAFSYKVVIIQYQMYVDYIGVLYTHAVNASICMYMYACLCGSVFSDLCMFI